MQLADPSHFVQSRSNMVATLPDFVPPIIALVDLLLIIGFFMLIIGLWRQRRWIAVRNAMNRLIVQYDPNTMTFAKMAALAGLNKTNAKREPRDVLEYAMLSLAEGSLRAA